MTPADYYYIVTGSCILILTLLICAVLVGILSLVRTVQRKLAAIKVPERLAVVSPWALVMQDVFREGFTLVKERFGRPEKPSGPEAPPSSHP
jgi:uncharacterized membrane protein